MLMDAVIVMVVYYLVLNFRYAGTVSNWASWTMHFAVFAGFAAIVHVEANWLVGAYSIVNRYIGLSQAMRVAQAGAAAVGILFLIVVGWSAIPQGGGYLVPRTVVIGGGLVAIAVMIALRFSPRVFLEASGPSKTATERVLLVGAGQAADMLIREIQRTPALGLQAVGLVDDDPLLRGMTIQGHTVLGPIEDAPELAKKHEVTQIIVAIPSASADQIARIYRICKPSGVQIKILPSLADLVSGTVSLRDARDLDIKDLLGRPKIQTNIGSMSEHIQGQTVLVTGAGGSIGSELSRQVAKFSPSKLVLVDHDESSLYDLHERLQTLGFTKYVLCPTNILQRRKIDKLFAAHRPRMVFHAAAYKHVPLMEVSPDEAVLNNIEGTLIMAETAARYGAERFINISTDKAVNPVNVMGATKRAGELIVRMVSERHPDTMFASVRFGNVLGSQGSVIPVFKGQIESGGPLVITHPDMTRYFMLIEEAVQLVLQAAIMVDDPVPAGLHSLDTFVLEMGDPVPIIELAQRMIEFYWKDQSKSIGVEFSGLRPGEKIDERLIWDNEYMLTSQHPLVGRVCAQPGCPPPNGHGHEFETNLRHLLGLAREHSDASIVIEALMQCVPGYEPFGHISVEKPLTLV
jgi:FlaA1/EpsC-like NDP-sugar epimerase